MKIRAVLPGHVTPKELWQQTQKEFGLEDNEDTDEDEEIQQVATPAARLASPSVGWRLGEN